MVMLAQLITILVKSSYTADVHRYFDFVVNGTLALCTLVCMHACTHTVVGGEGHACTHVMADDERHACTHVVVGGEGMHAHTWWWVVRGHVEWWRVVRGHVEWRRVVRGHVEWRRVVRGHAEWWRVVRGHVEWWAGERGVVGGCMHTQRGAPCTHVVVMVMEVCTHGDGGLHTW